MDNGRAPWRIVMFSLYPGVVSMFEQVLVERGHRLLAIFTAPGPRTRQTEDYKAVAQLARPGLDVVVSNQPKRWSTFLSAYRPDLLICVGFNWKLPAGQSHLNEACQNDTSLSG